MLMSNGWSLGGGRRALVATLPLARSISAPSSGTGGEPALQLTLAIIKPHIVKDPYSLQAIRQIALDDGFYFVRSTSWAMTTTDAEEFYDEHRGKCVSRNFYCRMTYS